MLAIVYEWQTNDKRPRRSNVKRDNFLTKTFNTRGIYIFCLVEALEFCWSPFSDEHKTLPKSTRGNVNRTNLHLAPHDYGPIMVTLIYVGSMKLLSLRRRRLPWRDVQSDEEGGEAAVFMSTNTNSIIRSTKKIDSLCVITGAWGLDGEKMVIFVSEY